MDIAKNEMLQKSLRNGSSQGEVFPCEYFVWLFVIKIQHNANHKNCLATGQLARESIITNLFGYIFINDLWKALS